MAGDSAITAVVAVRNTAVLWSADLVEAADTGYAYLDVSTMDLSKVIFYVTTVGDAAETITVMAGSTNLPIDGNEFTGAGIGNYTKATTVAGAYIIGPLDGSRFKTTAGRIKFKTDTATTGVISVRAIQWA